jgi:DNA-binding response OmpR family regulator
MKLLLIEDEQDLAQSIQKYLNTCGFICEWVDSVSAAIDKISLYEYDTILLDLMLADGDGFEVLKALKKQQKTDGVIIISAKENLDTRIEGFQLGADDYLIKPFHLSELLVRIQALIRRKQFNGSNKIIFEEIEIDLFSKVVEVHQKNVPLTKKEIDLLLYLIGNKNRVLSKSALAEHLSGDMADMLNSHDFVYAHIKNLKRKLKKADCNNYVQTVYGLGYKWQK